MRVLYDGWPLAYDAADSPAALHLLEVLALLPEGVDALVAAPANIDLNGVAAKFVPAPRPNTPRSRLTWEQIVLPRLAQHWRANLLHLTTPHPSLFKRVPTLVSPAEMLPQGELFAGGGQRLRAALGQGGFASGTTLLWPSDLPVTGAWQNLSRLLPPVVHPAFAAPLTAETRPEGLPEGLVEGFVFAPGPFDEEQAADLLAAWSWAAAGLGADWTLVLSGSVPGNLEELRERIAPSAVVQVVGETTSPRRCANFHFRKSGENREGSKKRRNLFYQAGAVMRAGPVTAWGDPLLYALAAGKGLAVLAAADAEQRGWQDARLGAAAFVAENPRVLGAAALSLIVEEELNERLSEAAKERAAGWGSARFGSALWEVYREIAGKP